MARFPVLKMESTVQENDKTRLDGSKSFTSTPDAAITLMEIEPSSGSGFLDITSNQYLDWQYSTEATETVSLRITTAAGGPTTVTQDIKVVSAATDKLFSNDQDLVLHEPDILQWVRKGRHSFLDVHRRAQDRIIAKLAELKFTDTNGDRLTKDAIIDIDEVRQWSTFLTLQLIFEGISNATDDIFSEKAKHYRQLKENALNMGLIRLDTDGDGSIDGSEKLEFRTRGLIRK